MKQGNKILRTVFMCIALICLVLAIGMTVTYLMSSNHSKDTMSDYRDPSDLIVSLPSSGTADDVEVPESSESMSSSAEIPSTDTPDSSGSTSSPENSPSTEDKPETTEPESPEVPEAEPIENPYTDSYLANEDMAAWLVVPGTVIDYPVMWTPRDENYYLKRDFNKKKSNDGCLILDTDSSLEPLTTNLIIHGHYRRTGTMFTCLHKYEDKDFYEDHKQIILHTEEKQRNYEVIAVFRSQVYKKKDKVFKFYKFFEANSQEEFDDFYNNIKKLSIYDTGVTAEFGDNFITLSTCAYHVENGRFVVVAKEVESGDTYLPIEH